MNIDTLNQIAERLARELVYWCPRCKANTAHVRRQWLGMRFEWCAICGRKESKAVSGNKCREKKSGRLTWL